MEYVIAAIFLVKTFLALVQVFFGILGMRRSKNYIGDVSDRVRFDPVLRRRANKVIIAGGACSFLLCLPPFLWSLSFASSGESFSMSVFALIVAYSFVTGSALLYPLERVKKLGHAVNSHD